MNKQKILTTIAMAIVFVIPLHFKFQRGGNGDGVRSVRLGFQWFGYMLIFGVLWSDMGDMYRNHIEGDN
jgi:hypothetical protein